MTNPRPTGNLQIDRDARAKNNNADPISHKRFFLEVKNNQNLLNQLTTSIQKRGGKIESFLNTNINYVVTNRPKAEWSPKQLDTQATTNIINSKASTRAGKMLQSTQNVAKTTDPLEMAAKFSMKIICANKLLEFLQKHFTNATSSDEKGKSGGGSSPRKLSPPFIKVVDNSFKYKTNYKELVEWPEVHFEYHPELCPFHKSRKPSISGNVSQQSTKSVFMLGRPNDKFQTVLTTPILTTPTLNATIQSKNISKRKHSTYCEICHKDYDDFEKHLKDETHAQFLENAANFKELHSAIRSLPSFQSFNQSGNLFKNRLSNSSFTDISSVISNSESPQNITLSSNDSLCGRLMPSPSTYLQSINKWESKNANGFMPLHKIIDDDDNSTGIKTSTNLIVKDTNFSHNLRTFDLENNENRQFNIENQL